MLVWTGGLARLLVGNTSLLGLSSNVSLAVAGTIFLSSNVTIDASVEVTASGSVVSVNDGLLKSVLFSSGHSATDGSSAVTVDAIAGVAAPRANSAGSLTSDTLSVDNMVATLVSATEIIIYMWFCRRHVLSWIVRGSRVGPA